MNSADHVRRFVRKWLEEKQGKMEREVGIVPERNALVFLMRGIFCAKKNSLMVSDLALGGNNCAKKPYT